MFIDEIKMLLLFPNSLESVPPTIFKPNPSPENENVSVAFEHCFYLDKN